MDYCQFVFLYFPELAVILEKHIRSWNLDLPRPWGELSMLAWNYIVQENSEGFVSLQNILVEIDKGVTVAWLWRIQILVLLVLNLLISKLIFQLCAIKVTLLIVCNILLWVTLLQFQSELTFLQVMNADQVRIGKGKYPWKEALLSHFESLLLF